MFKGQGAFALPQRGLHLSVGAHSLAVKAIMGIGGSGTTSVEMSNPSSYQGDGRVRMEIYQYHWIFS